MITPINISQNSTYATGIALQSIVMPAFDPVMTLIIIGGVAMYSKRGDVALLSGFLFSLVFFMLAINTTSLNVIVNLSTTSFIGVMYIILTLEHSFNKKHQNSS